VPKADVFKGSEHVRRRTTRAKPQICSHVTGLRLVRHRGTTALLTAEWLLNFADLRCAGGWRISSAIFSQGGGDEREGAEKLRVAVAPE